MKLGMFILVAMVIIIGVMSIVAYHQSSEITITVTDKAIERDSDGSKYLIYTDTEVYENTDNLFYGKFRSSNLYNDLKIDSTYTVRVIGWRVPFLSMYENIINIVED